MEGPDNSGLLLIFALDNYFTNRGREVVFHHTKKASNSLYLFGAFCFMKKCCTCKEKKDTSLFGKNKSLADGLARECNECRKQQRIKNYLQDPLHRRNLIRKYRSDNPDLDFKYRLRSEYNITLEHYNKRLKEQNNQCAGCSIFFKKRSDGHIDHCHTTGKFRGILCRHCNWVLGHSRDNITVLQNLIKYLSQNK